MKKNWTCQSPKLQKKHHLMKILYVRALCEKKQTFYFLHQSSFLSHFRRVVLGSWKRCVSITSIITPVHSWSCARATWTQITCRNTSVSSTGKAQVYKTSTQTKLNHQKHKTWPSCMMSNTSQRVITSEWEENLENTNIAPFRPSQATTTKNSLPETNVLLRD